MNRHILISLFVVGCTFSTLFPTSSSSSTLQAPAHSELHLDLHQCNSDLLRSSEALKTFIIKLCKALNIKRYGDPIITYFGDDKATAGYKIVQLLQNALITGQCQNATNTMYINISCPQAYDTHYVAELARTYFKARKCVMHNVSRT